MRSATSSKQRLRLWLTAFFLALATPTFILIYQSYTQQKWEAFHRHRLLAEEFATRLDDRVVKMLQVEDARPFSDYSFLNVAGDPAASFLQRSPLAAFPVVSEIPGVIGYFQVDGQGTLTTPLLPQTGTPAGNYGINDSELEHRIALQESVKTILQENKLIAAQRLPQRTRDLSHISGIVAPQTESDEYRFSLRERISIAEESISSQSAFDQLTSDSASTPQSKSLKKSKQGLGLVEELKLERVFAGKAEAEKGAGRRLDNTKERAKRQEQVALPEPPAALPSIVAKAITKTDKDLSISMFQSDIDTFELSMLDSGHFVLYRKVWRDQTRYIQGILLNADDFTKGIFGDEFQNTILASMSNLIVAFHDSILTVINGRQQRQYLQSAEELKGTLLYQTRLSAPTHELSLIFSINSLPAGSAETLLSWVSISILLILSFGIYLIYRLGVGHINLAQQQQDFVSAVSHELKTPLTSIRMYGEILREGWADEKKRRTYYDYIYSESERLTRLINNILQLARMTRNELAVELKSVSVAELMDHTQSKITSQVERTGFRLNVECDEEVQQHSIKADLDYFSQIMINLVDNAIKFSAKASNKQIDIHCQQSGENKIVFGVRDYGPGIEKDQLRKIFKLFYRSGNELTRETVGTGIGLALVRKLCNAMDGSVDVINHDQGAEFQVSFTLLKDTG